MDPTRIRTALRAAWDVRAPLHDRPDVTAYRLLDGRGDATPGIYLDRYGPAAVMSVYDDACLSEVALSAAAQLVLEVLEPRGLAAVYVKRFAKDRSRLGGRAPAETRAAEPRAGHSQPESFVVREYASTFEVRLYDGFSTGLFLEHREHRRALPGLAPRRALNLFAYTCGFAVSLVNAGVHVTNVDVSGRYLDWGKRNLAHNGLSLEATRFHCMDAFDYLAFAARHAEERFDLIVLDPPTFAAGDPRRGIRPWKATRDYPRLVDAAARVLAPGGTIFAATNTRELAAPGALARAVELGLGRRPRWRTLPPWPIDVREPGRVAAVCVS